MAKGKPKEVVEFQFDFGKIPEIIQNVRGETLGIMQHLAIESVDQKLSPKWSEMTLREKMTLSVNALDAYKDVLQGKGDGTTWVRSRDDVWFSERPLENMPNGMLLLLVRDLANYRYEELSKGQASNIEKEPYKRLLARANECIEDNPEAFLGRADFDIKAKNELVHALLAAMKNDPEFSHIPMALGDIVIPVIEGEVFLGLRWLRPCYWKSLVVMKQGVSRCRYWLPQGLKILNPIKMLLRMQAMLLKGQEISGSCWRLYRMKKRYSGF